MILSITWARLLYVCYSVFKDTFTTEVAAVRDPPEPTKIIDLINLVNNLFNFVFALRHLEDSYVAKVENIICFHFHVNNFFLVTFCAFHILCCAQKVGRRYRF